MEQLWWKAVKAKRQEELQVVVYWRNVSEMYERKVSENAPVTTKVE